MVLVKDIIKEGFIKFEDESLKDISQEEYDQLIKSAYINQLKYCNGNVDPKVKEKYDKESGVGTMISTMIPYSMALLIGWSVLLIIWIMFNLPFGIA